MGINKTVIIIFFASLLHAQFKPGFVSEPKEDTRIEAEDYYDEDQIERFNHKQKLSMSFFLKRGAPLSMYSYSNIFSYEIREDLVADVKIHGRFSNNLYQPLLGGGKYLSPHVAMDAGIKYSPLNNGVFDFHIRTFHDQWWSGQSAYLSFLGIPIKRLYKSKSFDHYQGSNTWNQ
tara:strand:+ start:114 stop:638 length:525 start_codon:yes stop_codon:yes gene_type:complete